MKSEPVCHFIYISNNRNITLPQITNDEEKNELLYNYSNVIDELVNFDMNQLKPITFEVNEDSDSDWEFTSSSTYYNSESDFVPESSENSSGYNEDDLEYARIPSPPPPPPKFKIN